MEKNNRSKKVIIKNHTCHCFDASVGRLVQIGRFSCQWFYSMKNQIEIFWFMTFCKCHKLHVICLHIKYLVLTFALLLKNPNSCQIR